MKKERDPLFQKESTNFDDSIGDLSSFRTKPRPRESAIVRSTVQEIANQAGFYSRENRPNNSVNSRKRTGRNMQINIKAHPDVIESFNEIAEKYDWSKALTFERALASLQQMLENGIDPKNLTPRT